ncbi:hypothetical protein GIB67_032764 [Kingdonia uniflora]|uniref:Uncharacterized protein n=1 Tax=Kingdonia uniflora TaxID=39325 RepID=A0A7J7MWF1_9MAGN|nr:hypothetical protein GIB67_032764 [Kingdonia uniflora]
MPIYQLSSKILCRVIDIQLKVEADTDEVFAQVTLLLSQIERECLKSVEESTACLMESNKKLTAFNKIMAKQIKAMLVAVMVSSEKVASSEVIGDKVYGSEGGSSKGRWKGLLMGSFTRDGQLAGFNPMNLTLL